MNSFEQQFAGAAGYRQKGTPAPEVVAACSDRPAEAAVIGAILRDEKLVDVAADKLRAEDFSDPLFSLVFSTVVAMVSAGEIASAITVARRLANDEDLTGRGGARYLGQLVASDSVARGPGYLDHLADLSRRRHLNLALAEARADIADTGLPLDSSAAAIDMALSAALFSTTAREAIGLADAWNEAIGHARAVGTGEAERGARIARLLEWNELTGGMSPGELILLGGRPGMGKTAVSLAVARGAAEAGHGVLFVSREMSVDQLMLRLVADMLFEAGSRATFEDVRSGRMSEQDFALAAQIGARIANWPLVFEEPPRLNVSRVASLIRKHQRRLAKTGHKLTLVVVDYLGLLEPPQKRSNREQEMGDTSRELKIAAKATGTTILALAQLNRAVEQRDDKRPHLADLRDSGSLEQDADTVVFAYRAEYYLRQAEPDAADLKKRQAWDVEMAGAVNRLELHAAKVRQGATQRRQLHFFGSRQAVRSDDFYRTGGMA